MRKKRKKRLIDALYCNHIIGFTSNSVP